jgi:Tfp pilus assembly protein PilV
MSAVEMPSDRSSAARRAPWRAYVLARLRCQRGDTLIEVVVGALMVALIATATLGGFTDIGHLSESQRNEEQAASVAQADQSRLKSLTIAQLVSNGPGTGNTTSQTTVDGTVYQVVSSSRFISGSTGTLSCTSSSASADIVQTSSSVTWPSAQGKRNPVVVHGEITPSEGGSLVVPIQDDLGNGVTGVTVSISGPSASSPVTTDSSGCVVFSDLQGGSYTISYAVPTGWVTTAGTTPSSQTVAVTTTGTQHAPAVVLGQASIVQASFQTTLPTGAAMPSASDQFVLAGPNSTVLVSGTDSTSTNASYASPLSSTQTVFPWDQSLGNAYTYTAYAGSCTGDKPTNPVPTPFYVTPGTTVATTVAQPAMIINVTGNTFDDPASTAVVYSGTWTHVTGSPLAVYGGTYSYSSSTNSYVSVTFTGSSIYWLGIYGKGQGKASVSVDNGSVSTVDMYSSTTTYQKVNSITGLSTGTHTLKILVSGNQNGSATGDQIAVDAFNAPSMTAPVLPSTIVPNVSVQDNGVGCASNKDYPPTVADTNANQGVLQYAGEPWGTNFTVCVDDGAYTYTTTTAVDDTVVHTGPAWTGAQVSVPLGAGATGVTAGVCP